MCCVGSHWIHQTKRQLVFLGLLSLVSLAPHFLFAKDKKSATPKRPVIDYSNIVWPNPPAIARIKYQTFYASQQLSQVQTAANTKSRFLDKLAGTQTTEEHKPLFQLAQPYGMAVDSKGNLYVADSKVGAIFIFDTENRTAELIKNRTDAHFVRIVGLAIDDSDRLFVADPGLRHVLVFDAAHKPEEVITEGLVEPTGLAIDRENRLLYVSDVELDQVLVYDADTFKLLRKIGTTGHKHELTTPGDFAKPIGMAVDSDGNLYVADTLNDRIEIFDADGVFLRSFGKNSDGPGGFGRPKGVAVDSDGHIWVSDGLQDRVQVFTQEAELCIAFGSHGLLPGQFQGLAGITIDKSNRVFTSEIYPGRVQQFRYVTDAESGAEKERREKARQQKAESKPQPATENVVTPKANEQSTATK